MRGTERPISRWPSRAPSQGSRTTNPLGGLWRRIASFGALSLFASLSPLLVLPFVARSVPPHAWATLLTCQAVGQLLGLVLLAGWGVDGQARVASSRSADVRRSFYVAAFRQRSRLSLLLVPLAACVGVLLADGYAPATHALMAVAATWSGLGFGWYAIGSGQPAWIAKYEAAPRLAASGASALIVGVTSQVWVYPSLLILVATLGICVFNREHAGGWFPVRTQASDGRVPRTAWAASSLSLVGAGYAGAPLPISQLVQLATAPQVASADRLYRYALFTVSSLANALQQWVLSSDESDLIRAQRLAVSLHLLLGLLGGACFVLLAEPVGSFLFGVDVAPSTVVAAGYGAAFFFVSTATPLTRNVLIPSGMTGRVLKWVVASALLGVCCMTVGGAMFGAVGLAWALALADGFFLTGVAISCLQLRNAR